MTTHLDPRAPLQQKASGCSATYAWTTPARCGWRPLAARIATVLVFAGLLLARPCGDAFASNGGNDHRKPPNILFIIMDDVGIDQMQSFGYGGETPPDMPTIEAIGNEGVLFRNAWAMPACSTTRALLFTGRYPVRTEVNNPLGQRDLASSMVSPYDMTTPKVLAERGYESALFGKFHIALQANNEAELLLPYSLGWDYFAGWLDETGDPSSIDTTAGGVARRGTYACGFVPGADQENGADSGACYMPDDSCSEMSSSGPVPPGRTCRDQGGIFDPDKRCQRRTPGNINFDTYSGHYVSPLVYNYPDGTKDVVDVAKDPRARRYRGQVVVEEAIEWINERPKHKPWMATVSFATAHTPVMQPPVEELRSSNGSESRLQCDKTPGKRALTNLMIEAMDFEVERLLVETGLATMNENAELEYDPTETNTVVIILGDNGTLANTVKFPFDPTRAKGTAYQTGAWVPLIIAGPMVKMPDRTVPFMVNAADLFQLFGEIAGIDVHEVVPRPLDSQAVMPYLVDPTHERIRTSNFTMLAPNLQKDGEENGPCVIGSSCVQLPPTAGVCTDNGGVWWGEGAHGEGIKPGGVDNCCEVNQYLAKFPNRDPVNVVPETSVGMRDARYKIVKNTTYDWDDHVRACRETTTNELYRINEHPWKPRLDRETLDLKPDPDGANLSPLERWHYNRLSSQLDDILLPDYGCQGDGNIDFVVDREDLRNAKSIANSWGLSSTYDFNLDGFTNDEDIWIIEQNLDTICPITVQGEDDPQKDPQAVQAAVNLGVQRGGEKGRVVMKGHFDFSDCPGCIEIHGPVMIEGTGDPSGEARPDPRRVTVINSDTRSPFVIKDDSSGEGTIHIERLWFASAKPIALQVSQLNSTLLLTQNRFTGITGQAKLRFAVGGAALGPAAGNLKGRFHAYENHIDTRGVRFPEGDDNGFAFAQCDFDHVDIRNNRIYTRGEGVEIEGCNNPDAVIEIVGNELITDATVSNLAPLTTPTVLDGIGGHPAVLKVIGSKAKHVLIADNQVRLRGWPTAICIMPGLTNEEGTMSIEGNYCNMSGQFAAVLAGWAGFPAFFPPFYLQNSTVRNNVFEGWAQHGVAFSDFLFDPSSSQDEWNLGNGNLFKGNSFRGLRTDGVALFFGASTQTNVFIGDPNGVVVDLGTNNQVIPK
ncbi:MAG: sulfatase-like hydrolase/transferase [Chromatiaceae bacterium]|nr:sulfatase-like hydrolase/transferase [Chromatiaceae bacterium]